jgi:hypothetical protein
MNLSRALMEAAKTFHTRRRGILGLDYNPDTHKAKATVRPRVRPPRAGGWARGGGGAPTVVAGRRANLKGR